MSSRTSASYFAASNSAALRAASQLARLSLVARDPLDSVYDVGLPSLRPLDGRTIHNRPNAAPIRMMRCLSSTDSMLPLSSNSIYFTSFSMLILFYNTYIGLP
ncbi:hypothetical protein EVAR_69369_1 [Eumeta japonica]|uniref:Uncharacterized protein n=1 Tax=Eumeta variegata TaxID=151549 RepID=A0A4C1T9X2_EUMVA|nr:hypothetical protein EVAR_69369_1 [Eumeta japonica]